MSHMIFVAIFSIAIWEILSPEDCKGRYRDRFDNLVNILRAIGEWGIEKSKPSIDRALAQAKVAIVESKVIHQARCLVGEFKQYSKEEDGDRIDDSKEVGAPLMEALILPAETDVPQEYPGKLFTVASKDSRKGKRRSRTTVSTLR